MDLNERSRTMYFEVKKKEKIKQTNKKEREREFFQFIRKVKEIDSLLVLGNLKSFDTFCFFSFVSLYRRIYKNKLLHVILYIKYIDR